MTFRGLTIIELVEALDKRGLKSLSELEKIPPNPLLWNRKDWLFAVDIISKSTGLPEADIKKTYTKAGDLLKAFNTALRKTGLIIELQRISKVSEKDLIKSLPDKWDEEWVDERAH